MPSLNQRIADARRALGMTQEQVAAAMNVSRQTVSHWENGRVVPDEAVRKQLFALLQIPEEEPQSAPDPEPAPAPARPRLWPLAAAFLCGVALTLAVVYGLIPALIPEPQPAAAPVVTEAPTPEATALPDATPVPDGSEDGTLLPPDFPAEWYREPAENIEGQAYLHISPWQSPVLLTPVEDAPFPYVWNVVFSMEETNGVPFTITRMTEVFFNENGEIGDVYIMGHAEATDFFQDEALQPHKSYAYNIGRPACGDTGYGLALEGVDENGYERAFSLYVPLSQEIEKQLTPEDFAPAVREEGKAFIAMTPESNPFPLVQDAFFDGGQGWYFNMEIQNETDIPFTPGQMTLALFSKGNMYSVINMPGSLVQEWLGAERFVKDESSLSYRDAACLQPVDQMGLRLTGTDDGGNELTFAVLVDLAQEPEQ